MTFAVEAEDELCDEDDEEDVVTPEPYGKACEDNHIEEDHNTNKFLEEQRINLGWQQREPSVHQVGALQQSNPECSECRREMDVTWASKREAHVVGVTLL
eukprot:2341577-Amphidinium_carterae.1